MPRKNSYEPLLNGELARLLSEHGLEVEAELPERGKQMDVVVDVDGVRVVLEAEIGSRAGAIRDADRRLTQGLTSLVFAVSYPSGMKIVNDLVDVNLDWTLRSRTLDAKKAREGDNPAWDEGTVRDLADAVRHAPEKIAATDRVAQQLSDALDGAVQRLPVEKRVNLAMTLDLPRGDDYYQTAAKRGLLVIATAILFHHRLHSYGWDKEPPGSGEWPPASPVSCAQDMNVVASHRQAWQSILAYDYKPVFDTAVTALDALPTDMDGQQNLRELAEHVGSIAARIEGVRHDLLGRIFHRILDTARYDGSFYTGSPAAALLAALAIRPDERDWSDHDVVEALRVCDPACGTGTLLMAAAERVYTLRREAKGLDEDIDPIIDEAMVEKILWGYDTNLTATHLTASTLGMLSPSTKFKPMNVHRTLLGWHPGPKGEGRIAYTGSLEFLDGSLFTKEWPSAQQVDEDEITDRHAPPPMDLVIMNPPFTRDSLRHDQFSPEEEAAIKAREKFIMGKLENTAAARLSGSANAFLVLGEKMVKDGEGNLSVILPTVMATNPAAQETRLYLADRFHIDTIVSSHDPKRIAFSENTHIGEILLVCRRRQSGESKPTRVLNLVRNPETTAEALDLARRIDANDGGGGDGRYTVQYMDAERIAAGDWYAVNFLSPWLVEEYHRLMDMSRLGEIANVGPDGRAARGTYRKQALPTKSGRRALWHHKTDITMSMKAHTDVYIEPVAGKNRAADRHWEYRGRLLLANKVRLNTARVNSVIVETPALGSLWVPCHPREGDEPMEFAICAWFNSSPGILATLGGRDNHSLSRPAFSLDTLRSLPVPAITAAARDKMASALERLGNQILQPLPHMADDPVRAALDDAVADALEMDREWVARVRRELAREPSVTNRQHGA